jgi:hypothetical protein
VVFTAPTLPMNAVRSGGTRASMAAYPAATAALALAVGATGRPLPYRPAVTDVVLLSVATHRGR